MKKKEEKKYLKRRCIIHLPSSFVHRYFPLVHLWPFQSLLFYRFLLLQVKHCVQQDPGEQSKMKCVTFRRRWVSEVVRAYPLRWMHFHNNFFRSIKATKYCEEFSAKVYGLHFLSSRSPYIRCKRLLETIKETQLVFCQQYCLLYI